MEHGSHICSIKSSKSGENRTSRKRKQIIDKFKCGGCKSRFDTICVLHAHCNEHATGSYFFDSMTSTAFPKYENKCAYTQVNAELIDLELRNSCTEVSVPVAEDSSASVIQSNKREIRVRKSKVKAKEKKIWCTSKTKVKDEDSCKKGEADKLNEATKDIVNDEKSSDLNNIIESNHTVCIRIKELLKTKLSDKKENDDSSKEISTDKVEDIKDFSISTQNISQRTLGPHLDQSKKRCQRNRYRHNNLLEKTNQLENLESQKTDELAASEALIAISEGVSAISVKQELTNAIEEIQRQLNNESELQASEVGSKDTETSIAVDNKFVDLRNNRNDNKAEEEKSGGKTQTPTKKGHGKNKQEDSKEKTLKCPVCGKMGGQSMINYHKYMHAETKEFTCETCGASFRTPLCLQIHQKQHTEKQFTCNICSAAFHRKQYLRTHMMKHTGEVPYMCDFCGKSYREKNNLTRHIRHVHEKVRKYECDICKEKFFRSDHLQNHRLRHDQASKKCPYCPRMFKHPDDLLRHTKTHTGEKKWHCHLCFHGFVSVSPYYVHMQKKHGINRDEAKVLKNKLQAEHKQRLANTGPKGKPVVEVKDNSNQEPSKEETSRVGPTLNDPPPLQAFHVSNNIITNISEGHQYYNQNVAVGKPTDNPNIDNGYSKGTQGQSAMMESCDNLIPINNEHTQEVAQYLLGFGSQQLIDGENVILEDGSCLDHYEIEIGHDEFGGGNMHSVMFVDSQQLSGEIVIQNG